VNAPHRRLALAAGALAAGLAAAPAAFGATAPFAVQVGAFDGPNAADLQGFYPRNAVIRAGDSLTFKFGGFHTVAIPARGKKPPGPVAPFGGLTPPTNDAAGAPYWFSGQPLFGLNGAAFGPSKSTTYTGRNFVSSGARDSGKFTVKFTKAGVYKVYCALHPKMQGKVTVLAKKRTPPSGAVQKRAGAAQRAADKASVKRLLKQAKSQTATGATVLLGTGSSRVSIYQFFPAARTVPVGTTVTFRMSGRNEIHTATFGPTAYVDAVQAKAFEGPPTAPIDSEGFYPSDPPPAVPSLTPTTHGNGFVNSGVLTDPGIPGAKAFRIKFDAPGAYEFRCLVHPFMRGTITVA
jgi:plastocyanin